MVLFTLPVAIVELPAGTKVDGAVRLAELVSVPAVVAVPVMVNTTAAALPTPTLTMALRPPLPSRPTGQLEPVPAVQVHDPVGLKPAGRLSVTVRPVTGSAVPLFGFTSVTRIVYVTAEPLLTEPFGLAPW